MQRDDANSQDIIMLNLLTGQVDRKYFIWKLIRQGNGGQNQGGRSSYQGVLCGQGYQLYMLEEAWWMDDTDFRQLDTHLLVHNAQGASRCLQVGTAQAVS
eukprot:6887526-Ditylum_brightwellii.AAC.1